MIGNLIGVVTSRHRGFNKSHFVQEYNIATNSELLTLPLVPAESYDFDVYWGDGTSETVTTDSATHVYASIGVYNVEIKPRTFNYYAFTNTGDKDKLLRVRQWGDFKPLSLDSSFYNCSNLYWVDPFLDTSLCTSLFQTFRGCGELLFLNCESWITSNVETIKSFVHNCHKLTTIGCSSWDTSKVTDMASFATNCNVLKNINVGGWDTSLVQSFSQMFRDCFELESISVSNWDTASATTMYRMFRGCHKLLTADVSLWDVQNVISTEEMYLNANLVQTVDVAAWVTSSLQMCNQMVRNCTSLIGFNPSSWNVSQITTGAQFMDGTSGAMTTATYDILLANWSVQSVQNAVLFNFNGLQYTISTSQSNRDILTNAPNNWTITDGGGI